MESVGKYMESVGKYMAPCEDQTHYAEVTICETSLWTITLQPWTQGCKNKICKQNLSDFNGKGQL